MIGKILIAALIIFAAWYGYNNYKYDTTTVCIENQEELVPVTCEVQDDCVMYLTSAYTAGYPRSDLYTGLLTQVTSCKENYCYLKSFDFAENMPNKRCEDNMTSMLFKVTLKDIMAVKGGLI